MEFNYLSIIFVASIVILLLVTIFIDNYPKIKKEGKIKVLVDEEDEYFVHPNVKSILNLKDPNGKSRRNEKEYIDNGKQIMDVFSYKINEVIKDI